MSRDFQYQGKRLKVGDKVLRLGIAVIVAGLMVIVFMVLFGFPVAPPRPVEPWYAEVPAAPYDPRDVKAPCEGADKENVVYLHDAEIQQAGGDAGRAINRAMAELPDCGGTVDMKDLRGEYELRQPIELRSNTTLLGNGQATMVLKTDGYAITAAENVTNSHVDSMSFFGGPAMDLK